MERGRILIPILPLVIPFAARWVRQQEAIICAQGVPLDSGQLEDARKVGVLHPEKIRLQYVEPIPMPTGRVLTELGLRTGVISQATAGITLGYGIFIRSPFRRDRSLCVHECVHVGQYERFGSIEAFLRDYLRECLDPGYPFGVLEQEAITRAAEIAPEI